MTTQTLGIIFNYNFQFYSTIIQIFSHNSYLVFRMFTLFHLPVDNVKHQRRRERPFISMKARFHHFQYLNLLIFMLLYLYLDVTSALPSTLINSDSVLNLICHKTLLHFPSYL